MILIKLIRSESEMISTSCQERIAMKSEKVWSDINSKYDFFSKMYNVIATNLIGDCLFQKLIKNL